MVDINRIRIEPAIVNTSCAWASDLAQLEELYYSPYTGAVTTRTATVSGFVEDSSHAVCTLSFPRRSILADSSLGCLWEHIGIDFEFCRLFTSPAVHLRGLGARYPLPWYQPQTVYYKHHVELRQRTGPDG